MTQSTLGAVPSAARIHRGLQRGVVAAAVAGLTLLVVPATSAQAAPVAIALGRAGQFSVLAATTVTNTGATTIDADADVGGNLGVSPGLAVTGFPPGVVNPPGTQHRGDTLASQAQSDLTAAYDTAAATPCDANLSGTDLGGLTLTGGTYCFDTAAAITGTLTLDAVRQPGAVFVFRVGSALTTSASSAVLATNGAQACNVFWQIGSSATLGATSAFSGNVLAATSVSVGAGTGIEGRLLARDAAVTLDSDTIHTAACAPTTGVAQAPLFGRGSTIVTFGALAAGVAIVVGLRRRGRSALPAPA